MESGLGVLRGPPFSYAMYYLTEKGILRIRIVPVLLLPAIYAISIIVAWLVGFLLRYSVPTGAIGLLVSSVLIVLPTIAVEALANLRWRRISGLNAETLASMKHSVTFVPWSEVTDFGKEARVWIWVRTRNKSYSMTTSWGLAEDVVEQIRTRARQGQVRA